MELIPKYKKAEVGIIRKDWNAETIAQYVEIKSGESPSLFRFVLEGTPYFKVEQLNSKSRYIVDTPYLIQSDRKVARGSLIFPKRGASILLNKIRILAKDSFMDTNLMTLTPKATVHSEFLYYALSHIELWRIADTTSIPQINNKHITPLVIPLPPTKVEQQAIAEALSDADALIESLEQLLAKKHLIKQGAMQELLTGKRRLSGFGGNWISKSFGEVAPLQRGFDLPNARLRPGSFPVVYSNGILNHHSSCQVKGPGVITGRSGTIGTVTFVEQDFWPHNTALWVTSFKGNDPKFVFYLYSYIGLDRFATGSGVPTLNRNDVHGLKVLIPESNEEQTAIAEILSDMDADIAALEEKLNKARQIKQGMMAELLTGRIRLV